MTPYASYITLPLQTQTINHQTKAVSYGTAGNFHRHFGDLSCSGIVKSNFHNPNPWSFNKRRRSNYMDAFFDDGRVRTRFFGPYWNMPEGLNTWHESELALAKATAMNRLTANIRGRTDLSVDGFQLKQTLALKSQVRQILRRTAKMLTKQPKGVIKNNTRRNGPQIIGMSTKLKKPQSTGAFGALTVPADIHLAWVYGVKPTLQSIYDGIVYTKNHYYGLSKMYTGKCTLTRYDSIHLPNYLDNTWFANVKIVSSVRCLIKVRLEIPDESLTQMARLTSLNPASIAWELLPWSFVIDWFLNIGDYLRNLETALIYNQFFKSGFVTTSWNYAGDLQGFRKPYPGATVGGSHVCTSSDKHSERVVLTGMPEPHLPRLRASLGAARLTNAAALLTTFLRR